MKNVLIISMLVVLASCCPLKKNKEEAKAGTVKTTEIKTVTLEELEGKTWVWVETVMNNDTKVLPKGNSSYIVFAKDGRLNIQGDCNKGSGTYILDGKSFSVGPIMATKMACLDSKEQEFFGNLNAAVTVFMSGDFLYMDLKMDTGTMKFEEKK